MSHQKKLLKTNQNIEKSPFFSRYSPPLSESSDVGSYSMTCQEFKAETDINNMINKFYSQGFVPPPTSPPIYGDFTTDFDYTDYHNILDAADDFFNRLPSKIRDDFNNDPAKFFDDYCRNPNILAQYSDVPVVNESHQVNIAETSNNEENIVTKETTK